MRNPMGIDAAMPRLSWKLRSKARDVRQSAYQLRVAPSLEGLADSGNLFFDTGKVDSDESNQLPYPGPALKSRLRYFWQVRIWDEAGALSNWSVPAWFEMGLLSIADWRAQ